MSKCNFFISYSTLDGSEIAQELFDSLSKLGYSVFIDTELAIGDEWDSKIKEMITDCDCFIPIITDGYLSSSYVYDELNFALSTANDRAKDILPIVLCSDEQFTMVSARFNIQNCIKANDNSKEISYIVTRIVESFNYKTQSALLYEKLSAFTKINDKDKAAETVCQLLILIKDNYQSLIGNKSRRIALYQEIYRLYEILYYYYGGSYSEESKRVVKIIIPTLSEFQNILFGKIEEQGDNIFLTDIYCISFSIRIYYLCMEIRNDCIDTWTSGDVVNSQSADDYIKSQEKYVNAYYSYVENSADYELSGQYSEEEVQFIKDTQKYIISQHIVETANLPIRQKQEISNSANELSEDEQILLSIANFTKEGNRLFNLLRKKGSAGDFLRCLLTSYERLKNYCEIVGAHQIVSECVEQMAEIRAEISNAGSNQGNELAEKGIKSLLGITLPGTDNYDVFISFKSQDEDLGKAMYDFLRKNMKEPFWSKVSLPELSESEYEKAIYNALDKAKHFVVVLSNLSYMTDSWVEKEMRIFHREKNENRKPKDSNFIFVVTDDLYKQIIDSNKTLIPIEYRGYQIIKMSEYKNSLLQYIK